MENFVFCAVHLRCRTFQQQITTVAKFSILDVSGVSGYGAVSVAKLGWLVSKDPYLQLRQQCIALESEACEKCISYVKKTCIASAMPVLCHLKHAFLLERPSFLTLLNVLNFLNEYYAMINSQCRAKMETKFACCLIAGSDFLV